MRFEYVIGRLLQTLLVMFLASILAFSFLHVLPGEVADGVEGDGFQWFMCRVHKNRIMPERIVAGDPGRAHGRCRLRPCKPLKRSRNLRVPGVDPGRGNL